MALAIVHHPRSGNCRVTVTQLYEGGSVVTEVGTLGSVDTTPIRSSLSQTTLDLDWIRFISDLHCQGLSLKFSGKFKSQ